MLYRAQNNETTMYKTINLQTTKVQLKCTCEYKTPITIKQLYQIIYKTAEQTGT
jgi:hypothetical protein